METNYNLLSSETKIDLGIQFIQSGAALPEDLRTFLVQNNLYEQVKTIGASHRK